MEPTSFKTLSSVSNLSLVMVSQRYRLRTLKQAVSESVFLLWNIQTPFFKYGLIYRLVNSMGKEFLKKLTPMPRLTKLRAENNFSNDI